MQCLGGSTLVADSVRRLYAMNDKNISDERLVFVCAEIQRLGVGERSIVQALDELGSVDLPDLKFHRIRKAILDKKENVPRENCELCCEVGFVSMVDINMRRWSFACRCKSGEARYQAGVERWNGQERQTYKGLELKLCVGGE